MRRTLSILVAYTCLGWFAWEANTAEDFSCRISQKAVEKFVVVAFPMEVSGAKKLGGQAFGNLAGEIKWNATVTDPEITIGEKRRSFRAKADVTVPGMNINWKGIVEGRLDIDYDAASNALVVRVRDAIVPVDAGFVKVEIDVSDDIPEFRFKVAMPEVSLPNRQNVIRVDADPRIGFDDGGIVVSSDLEFELKR
jgi:hypothetical protein